MKRVSSCNLKKQCLDLSTYNKHLIAERVAVTSVVGCAVCFGREQAELGLPTVIIQSGL